MHLMNAFWYCQDFKIYIVFFVPYNIVYVLDYPTNKSGYVPEKKEVEIDNTNDQFHCFRNNNQQKSQFHPSCLRP